MKSLYRLLGTVVMAGALAACSSGNLPKADYQVIPLPQQVAADKNGTFRLDNSVKIIYPDGNEQMQKNADFLAGYIQQMTGLQLQTAPGTASANARI